MRKLILTIGIGLIFFSSTHSQVNESWPPLKQLREDYNNASLVAHVRFDKVEKEDELGGYVTHHVYCQVIEPYKGKIVKGQKLEYYAMAEKIYDMSGYQSEKIVFLEGYYNKTEKKWNFSELENSWVDPTKDVVAKMNKIRSRRKRH